MSPEKTGLREFLHRIDPAFSEELFDISSAKILGKQFIPGSPFQTAFGKIVDPRLIAGAALVWKGVYRDYSLRAKLEQKRQELLEEFRKFLR